MADEEDASSTAEMDKKKYGVQRRHLEQPQKRIGISEDEFGDQPPPEDHRRHNITEMLPASGKSARP